MTLSIPPVCSVSVSHMTGDGALHPPVRSVSHVTGDDALQSLAVLETSNRTAEHRIAGVFRGGFFSGELLVFV